MDRKNKNQMNQIHNNMLYVKQFSDKNKRKMEKKETATSKKSKI